MFNAKRLACLHVLMPFKNNENNVLINLGSYVHIYAHTHNLHTFAKIWQSKSEKTILLIKKVNNLCNKIFLKLKIDLTFLEKKIKLFKG